ncbi:hypothetical protein TERTU_3355 [Teredinibacter turnerae T7901]|uniref:Uncharacterized protein n=1 Tax=Teredinibacter turnerae (strain ATCC 39867 / T7901) TaxID=377629 RepID=C5BQL7_TERTT|nr:hypothetical protein TERTU_3355 [Teredinibacter turnerae T7901]
MLDAAVIKTRKMTCITFRNLYQHIYFQFELEIKYYISNFCRNE